MLKRFSLVLLTIMVTTVFAVPVLSMELGNKRKGKYTYRKVYKACHERGEVDSKKPFLSPADKTMAEWENIYDGKDYSMFKCQEEWSNLNDVQVLDIFSYLYAHGSDSPTPAKCK